VNPVRLLWTHNFDPSIPGKGSFVNLAAEGIRARGVDLRLEYLGNLRSPAQVARARTHVKRLARDFDVVHAQFGSACALVTAVVEGIPKFLTLRGSDWSTYDLSLGYLYFHTRLAATFSRLAIKSYDYITTVSSRLAAQVAPAAPGAVVAVLPSPIDLSAFVPRDKRDAKAALGYPGCRERWILFNSLDLNNPIKRFRLARGAFELAQARLGNLRLRLATDLPRDKLPLFVAACDLILCTSHTEGWPNSVKEALACNVPFVATDVSDLRDIAAQEPSCRVCRADPASLADGTCDVLTGPEPRGLRRYVENMSVDAISERLIALYSDALAGYRSAGPGFLNAASKAQSAVHWDNGKRRDP
jgi:teichuronic acid biosynthesis glycosyltransferase TuaC